MIIKTRSKITPRLNVLVVGSGLSAYGACLALIEDQTIAVTVIDIGLQNAYQDQPNEAVPNSISLNGSFYPYGVNDSRCPTALHSKRMCSSHALGGFSKVFSGSVLKPKDKDLTDWPARSKPSIADYNAVLSSLRIWQVKDELNEAFSCFPMTEDHVVNNNTYVGQPRIALSKSDSMDIPYDCGYDFLKWQKQGLITYFSDQYVTKITKLKDKLEVSITTVEGVKTMSFDQIYIGAGCINTTAIVDLSIYGEGSRTYSIKCARGLLQLYLQLWISKIGRNNNGNIGIKNPDLCKVFVEHRSTATAGLWSHTQINSFNRTILQTIRQKLPPIIRETILAVQTIFRFSVTAFHSDLGPSSILISRVQKCSNGSLLQTIEVLEDEDSCDQHLVNTIRSAVVNKFLSLGLLPLPFGQFIADIMRGNRLGGWHYGGTLPMSDNPTDPNHLASNGELYGMKQVYVIDASGFPSIPGSTVALLTMANAYRIARKSIENYYKLCQ